MRTASNSPLTQKYGAKTTHVLITYRTVLFVLELINSLVLTQLRTGPKNAGSQFPSVKIAFHGGPPGTGELQFIEGTMNEAEHDPLLSETGLQGNIPT